MAKEKINMPMSGAGITRYFEDYRSKIELKPMHVLVFAAIVILIVVALHMYGSLIFGA